MSVKVSAIITTKNRHELLEHAIQSVLSQTYDNIECIVVDDASVDETQSIYEHDERVVYVRIEPQNSQGGNYARNQGILHASGEYLSFLDDDDEWLPSKIEKQMELAKRYPNSVYFCGRTLKKIDGRKESSLSIIPPINYSGDISRLIRLTYVTNTSCLFFAKKLLDQVGLFDEKLTFWQEYELTIRLAQIAHFYFVPEPLTICLDDSRNKNRVSNKVWNWKENVLYIRKKHRALFEELTFKENWRYHALLSKDAFRRSLRAGNRFNIVCYGLLRMFLEYIPSKILHIF